MKIDAHVFIGDGKHLSLSIDELLRRMDDAEVAFSIASPVDHYMAVHNREGNDLLIEAVRAHPDRLAGRAVANPWYGKSAVEELKRAFSEGLTGVMLHAPYQGFRLSDHLVDPLLDVADQVNAPVYAHTGTAGLAEPLHVVELARRFPKLNFIMGHSGSSDYSEDVVFAKGFLDNVWLETSRNGPANYNMFKNHGLQHRLVFGSSAPEYIPKIEIETLCDVFTEDIEQERIFTNNIRNVYNGRLPQ
jgi:uncharacterized protein